MNAARAHIRRSFRSRKHIKNSRKRLSDFWISINFYLIESIFSSISIFELLGKTALSVINFKELTTPRQGLLQTFREFERSPLNRLNLFGMTTERLTYYRRVVFSIDNQKSSTFKPDNNIIETVRRTLNDWYCRSFFSRRKSFHRILKFDKNKTVSGIINNI